MRTVISTLDQPDTETGEGITIAGRKGDAHDFKLDLEHALISETSGKLGNTGKRVEVHGTSSSTGLSETLTVEVYDAFPKMALLSATLKNDTQREIALEDVLLQRHRLNAKLATPGAAPHEMWSFHGSSLKWGKDDVFPVPAKFSQENPLGAPVATKDDLGEVGGGIPVVAMWTRSVGEAIGHIETLPLAVSIPVATDQDGLVQASVKYRRIRC